MRSRTASRKCRGNEAGEDLQALTAQVRKLVVRSFMVAVGWGRGFGCAWVVVGVVEVLGGLFCKMGISLAGGE